MASRRLFAPSFLVPLDETGGEFDEDRIDQIVSNFRD